MSQFFRRGRRLGTSPTHLGTRAVIQDTINEQRVLLMPGQSKLMPGQMPGYAVMLTDTERRFQISSPCGIW